MEVTRIIHPIGQGAFYTESIKTNDNLYNVVYDCGSGNYKYTPKRLKQDIASFYNPDDVIDLLFISHFDNDHINGIRELKKRTSKIRNIVVPLIEENDFWYYQIENPSFETALEMPEVENYCKDNKIKALLIQYNYYDEVVVFDVSAIRKIG